ncbi:hypothetical protein ACFQZS_03640 [Mucilaginibacter calamicampi]|uniref:Uncharacterized protein n=1 Tax=Mucilaginibacter calamicampi TaxID=1302352 RepID=A0ABW2YTB5_9SPHI
MNRVHEELNRQNDVGNVVANYIAFKAIEVVDFPTKDLNVIREYAQLIKTKGKGESACLAFCRHHPHIIASSNLRDINEYCTQHQLAYLTTMDILCIALIRGEMSESECDEFIANVRKAGSKLPHLTITQYRNQHFDHLKSHY